MACQWASSMWSRGWTVAIPPNISPDNRTLWVPALKQDRICLFTVSDDGHLVAQDPAEVTTVEGAARVIWYSIQTNNMRIASMS